MPHFISPLSLAIPFSWWHILSNIVDGKERPLNLLTLDARPTAALQLSHTYNFAFTQSFIHSLAPSFFHPVIHIHAQHSEYAHNVLISLMCVCVCALSAQQLLQVCVCAYAHERMQIKYQEVIWRYAILTSFLCLSVPIWRRNWSRKRTSVYLYMWVNVFACVFVCYCK